MDSAFRNLMFSSNPPKQNRPWDNLFFPPQEDFGVEVPEQRSFIQNYKRSDPRESDYYKMLNNAPDESSFERSKGAKVGAVLLGSLLSSLGDQQGMNKAQSAITAPRDRAFESYGNRLGIAKKRYGVDKAADDDLWNEEQFRIKNAIEADKRNEDIFRDRRDFTEKRRTFGETEGRLNRDLEDRIRRNAILNEITGRSYQNNDYTGEGGLFDVRSNTFTPTGKMKPSFRDVEGSKIADDRRSLSNSLTLSNRNFEHSKQLRKIPQATNSGNRRSASEQDSARKLAIQETLSDPNYRSLIGVFDTQGNLIEGKVDSTNEALLNQMGNAVSRRIDEILNPSSEADRFETEVPTQTDPKDIERFNIFTPSPKPFNAPVSKYPSRLGTTKFRIGG